MVGFKKIFLILILLAGVFSHITANAYEKNISIGIFSVNEAEFFKGQFLPTVKHLSDRFPKYNFNIVSLTEENIDSAIEGGKVQFLIVCPWKYVELSINRNLDHIATLERSIDGKSSSYVGSVLFTSKSSKISNISVDELMDKTIVAVDKKCLGGWLAAYRELKAFNLAPEAVLEKVRFLGSEQKVIKDVLSGNGDIGVVSTGSLELFISKGLINKDDFRVLEINPEKRFGFPFRLSTRTYSNLSMSAVQGTPHRLIKKISSALLIMKPAPISQDGLIKESWTVPHNYLPVLECFRDLRIGPYKDYGKVSVSEVVIQNWYWGLVTIIVLLILVAMLANSTRTNRKLREMKSLLSVELRVRKEAEKALRTSEKQFRQITENMNDMIVMTDQRGFFKYVSPSHRKRLEYGLSEMEDKTFFDYIHPDDLRIVKNAFEKILSRKNVGMVECRLLHANGSYVWFEISGSALSDSWDDFEGAIIAARDITGRKEAQHELDKAQLLLQTAIEQSPAGILIAEPPDVKIIVANSAALEMWDQKRDDFRKITTEDHPREWETFKPDGSIFPPEDLPLSRAVLNGEISENVEILIKYGDGKERWILANAAPIRDTQGNIIAGVVVFPDITSSKFADEEKVKLEDRLRQSVKMEAIGRLAGGIAHDFNNILTGIIGYSEIMLKSIPEHESFFDEVNEIRKAATKAAGLTQQLLAFSKKQVISPKVWDINEILANAEKMLVRVIGEDINLVFTPSLKVWPIKADRIQVDQILINLAVNARDAMPDGGSLIIESANVTIDSNPLQNMPEMPPGEYVMIAISDNGHGMSNEVRSRIFEPFFTTKEKGSGTGLGLATVYGAVKQNKGFIYVFSELRKGTTFKIFFPKTDEQIKEKISAVPMNVSANNEVILLVEDEEMVRELATKVLLRNGYKVLVAKNGSEALFLFRKKKDIINLLISDVVMPNMSGKELFVELVKFKPSLRVLFMSGYAENEIVHQGVLEKDTHFIQKPFTIDEFALKVREVLDIDN